MNTQDTSSRFSPKPEADSKSHSPNTIGIRPHILQRREARRLRRER